MKKPGLVWEWGKQTKQILDLSKLKAFEDEKIDMPEKNDMPAKIKISIGKGRKQGWKRRKC